VVNKNVSVTNIIKSRKNPVILEKYIYKISILKKVFSDGFFKINIFDFLKIP